MPIATRTVVRRTAVLLGAGGLLLGLSGTAQAVPPPPGCSAADISAVVAGVSTNLTTYLFTHPDVNNFFSDLQGQRKSDVDAQTTDYLAANPQVRAELDAIRAPSVDLRNRCGIPFETEISGLH